MKNTFDPQTSINTIQLLIGQYFKSTFYEKLQACHYLFIAHPVCKQNQLPDLAIDLLHDLIGFAYSNFCVEKSKQLKDLIISIIYANRISLVARFDLQIDDLYAKVNYYLTSSNTSCISPSLILLYSSTNSNLSGLWEAKLFPDINFQIKKQSIGELTILTISKYYSKKATGVVNAQVLKKANIDRYGSCTKIDEKVLVLFNLWLLNFLQEEIVFFDFERQLKILKKHSWLKKSKISFLIKFICSSFLKEDFVSPNVINKRSGNGVSDFSSAINNVLIRNTTNLKTDIDLIITSTLTIVFNEYYTLE